MSADIQYWEASAPVDITFGEAEGLEQALEVKKSAIIQDVKAEYEQQLAKMTSYALYDEPTGLKNRRALYTDIKELNVEQTAVIMIDINYLKAINDCYGHEKGDLLILTTSNLIKKYFGDNVYRLGGDEFCALMQDNQETIKLSIDAFRDELAKQYIGVDDFTITVGIGVGHGANHDNFDEVFDDADVAMYKNKESVKILNPQNINMPEGEIPRGADFVVSMKDEAPTRYIEDTTNFYEQADINLARQLLVKTLIWNGSASLVLSSILGIIIFFL